ncbi:3-dehydroquinate dehydratase [Tessaracoccus sp. MC1865]|uniref:type II 3-dehydroquinate dehydratase n=1 Tax=Tessaracoccus sp. MC1865 TaxID=2760310 RepID=UPI0016047053|nr:type II 3-dehydroquinate dehydratase [Tessaracoccus sp. MC1865]MBB1484501.1 3-dehydroquinate dehydratase [Tessaracoccus sp. MC1865]QTO38398.1 3-dehydroquinate dehydratase [Tessaracoccus sp. MC1865]
MRKVLVLNGPNLGRLGTRQPEIYGAMTYAGLAEHLVETGEGMGLEVDVRQTEHEGQMIEWLHEAADGGLPVVLNAGAWTHYSYAIADAAALTTYVEVHISNVHAREGFREHSVLSAKAAGIIIGCGVGGYDLALAHVAAM